MIADRKTDQDTIQINARLQHLIDAWDQDTEPTRLKICKQQQQRSLESGWDRGLDYDSKRRRQRRTRH